MKKTVTAEQVIRALAKDPQLLADVKAKLGLVAKTHAGFATQSIEHDFGQRNEGWSIFLTKDEATAWQREMNGGGWSYEGPYGIEMTGEVYAAATVARRIPGKSNSLPRGTLITMSMVTLPKAE